MKPNGSKDGIFAKDPPKRPAERALWWALLLVLVGVPAWVSSMPPEDFDAATRWAIPVPLLCVGAYGLWMARRVRAAGLPVKARAYRMVGIFFLALAPVGLATSLYFIDRIRQARTVPRQGQAARPARDRACC